MSTNHTPPASARGTLGAIESLLRHPDTQEDRRPFLGSPFICTLPGGALYFESALEVDTDGSVFARQDPDGNRHGETTAHDRDDHPLDADAVNYFVLPGDAFARGFGIHLGDVAAVIYRDSLAYGCYADNGPPAKLGEGSLALHRDLGHERTLPNGGFLNDGIDRDVVTIVFPNSGTNDPTNQNKVGVSTMESRVRGVLSMASLLQTAENFEHAELTRVVQPRPMTIPGSRDALLRVLRAWVQEIVAATPHPRTIDGRDPVEFLMATADGVDVLLDGRGQPPRPLFVTVDFETATDADDRWYVRRIWWSWAR